MCANLIPINVVKVGGKIAVEVAHGDIGDGEVVDGGGVVDGEGCESTVVE